MHGSQRKVCEAIGCSEGQDSPLDDFHALPQLVLFDNERRGKADDVAVGGLSQQSVVTES